MYIVALLISSIYLFYLLKTINLTFMTLLEFFFVIIKYKEGKLL